MNLFDFFDSLINPPKYTDREPYISEEARVDAFVRRDADGNEIKLEPEVSQVLLEEARLKYHDKMETLDRLDEKRDSMIKFSSGMIVFMASASRVFEFPITACMQSAFVLFLLAIALLILSRRTVQIPSAPTIQDLREDLGSALDPRDRIASSLHLTCSGIRVFEVIIGYHYNVAMYLILAGLFCLIPVVFGISS